MECLLTGLEDNMLEMFSPVKSNCPKVEANLLKDNENNRYYISLVNFSGKPIKNLELTINKNYLNDVSEIVSVFQDKHFRIQDNTIKICLPINMFDFLIIK